MTARHSQSWRTLVPVLALVVASCGGSPPVTGSPIATASAAASPAGNEPAQPSGSLEPGPVALDLSAGAIVAAAAREDADRAGERALADMAGYLGPDSPALVAALDKQAADGLTAQVDAATAAATPPNAVLASVRLPRVSGEVVAGAAPPPGMSLMGPWAASMIIVDSPSSWDRAYSDSHHTDDEIVLGPNKGTLKTDTTINVTPSGSRLVVDVQLKQTGEVNDANGRLVFRINGTGHAHVDIQGCPDGQGLAPASLEFSSSEDYFVSSDAGRSGHSWQQDDTADARIFADDEANLDHVSSDVKTDKAVKGGTRAAGAGQSELTDYTIDAGETLTLGPDGNGQSGAGTFNAHNVTKADVNDAYRAAEQFLGIALWTSGKAAEKFWRSGKCIDVVVDPAGGDVAANSTTSVTVKVRHKFENNELDKPVEATMTGVKSIEPAGQRQPAPATFTYTAGAKPADKADVTFKSVSNRGIGQTTVTFTVGGGWKTESNGLLQGEETFKGQKCNGLAGIWRIDGRVNNPGVKQTATWTATIDGTTLAGTYAYKSKTTTITPLGSIVTTSTGTGAASLVAQPDGSLKMTIGATNVVSTAAGQSLSIPIPDMFFTWTPGGTCPA
jgi:hypothetical protein